MFRAIANLWWALPLIAGSLIALGVIYQKAIKPVVLGVNYIIEIGEYLQNEISGKEGSVKATQQAIQDELGLLKTQVDGMDTIFSKWVFSHAREHAEIWAIFARMGYDRRHLDSPVWPPTPAPGEERAARSQDYRKEGET